MKRVNLLIGASCLGILSLAGCEWLDRDRTEAELDRICAERCEASRPAITEPVVYVLNDIKWSPKDKQFEENSGSIWVQGVDGLYEHPNKGAKLNPDCFSKTPLSTKSPDGNSKLAELDLTEDNTTIMLINFTKDGALESRELSEVTGSQSQHVLDDIRAVLNPNTNGAKSDYELIRKYLSDLQGVTFSERPAAGAISDRGFMLRSLDFVPDDKTPFFKPLGLVNGNGVKEHAFFYVLLDERLKFNREGPGIIPYSPAAQNSIGHLYSPYIQYEISPSTLYGANSGKAEVMPVHFLRENMAENIPPEGPKSKCSYPYDLSVVAEGQDGKGEPDTPLLIDPETETDGPPL